MLVIEARNVNDALPAALRLLQAEGIEEQSRNGPVLVAPGPVLTCYDRPTERVLFSAGRDANPYFHLFEALWMLAGRNDLAWVEQFNKRFAQFSDNGRTLHAAYGRRWRHWHGLWQEDQLPQLVALLRREPHTRRAVLAMWEPTADLNTSYKDLPCNTHAYFDLRGGALNICVCCRSNDALWGAYGANSVHFSVLQEYIAIGVGAPVGRYRQFSYNLHAYTAMEGYPPIDPEKIGEDDCYASGAVAPYPMVQSSLQDFDDDLGIFLVDPLEDVVYVEPFFNEVARPMYQSWHERKEKLSDGSEAAARIAATDWRLACERWIARRVKKVAT